MKGYEWKSTLAPMIARYLDLKHMAGFKYARQETCLQHFDHFYYYSGYDAISFTKDAIMPFLYNQDEAQSTWCLKETLIADFARFLNERGYMAYVPVSTHEWPKCAHIPHIYTKDERIRFLHAVDTYPVGHGLDRDSSDPLLFRLLIGTGCRLSEALSLRTGDYQTDTGTVTIRHSKNRSSRTIPICSSLQKRMCNYIEDLGKDREENSLLFPGSKKNSPWIKVPYTVGSGITF